MNKKVIIDNLEISTDGTEFCVLNIIPEEIDDETDKDWVSLSKPDLLELTITLLDIYKNMEDE